MPDDPRPERLARSPELMNAADTALLVVDLQDRILGAIADAKRVVWNTRRLVDGAGLLGVPAAATEQYPEKLGPTAPVVAKRLAAVGVAEPLAKLAFSCGEPRIDRPAMERRGPPPGAVGRYRDARLCAADGIGLPCRWFSGLSRR